MKDVIDKIDTLFAYFSGIGFGTNSIKKELNSFKKYIKDGKIFVDVGGNKGIYTDAILKIYDPLEVHIFEPSQTNIKILLDKFNNNNKVFINKFGLSNSNSESVMKVVLV